MNVISDLSAALEGRYRVERQLGQGGMATVYAARDLRHDRLVALKVLRKEIAAAIGAERFLREIWITAQLSHPHILPLLDSGEANGVLYYVMPLVEGETLRDRLDREKQLPLRDALRITVQVADALAYAHSRGVVHRDIKPENILLSGGQAVVADFGIARAIAVSDTDKLTATGLAIGTPSYMSPEQAAGESAIDSRSDIYSLGCVLYETLAGQPPHTGPTAQAIIARRMADPPPSLRSVRDSVSEPLERAVLRALARTPADRYATATEFAAELERSGEPAPARRRVPWKVVVAGIAILALVAAVLKLVPRGNHSNVVASASRLAVLPFTQSGGDTTLARLGRDLVFTLSAELDGLGDIRVVDAHTILAQTSTRELSSPEAAALARRFSAGSLVQGSLVRDGDGVRLDFTLTPTDSSGAPLARGTVRGAADSVAALTDSVVHTLLKQIWVGENAPTPSLESALRTQSVAALRAFLEGEQHLARGEWEEATHSYGRARDADRNFWLASARMIFALNWSLQTPPESLVSDLLAHRADLPEADRLSTEAILGWTGDSVAQGLERARALTERYPSSWFGWLIYGDMLLHQGPLLGHTRAEATAAFREALERNADLIPVHEHLMLLALQAGDTAQAARALADLERLNAGPALTADGYGNRMLQFRFLLALIRGDSIAAGRMTDSIARDPTLEGGRDGTFYDPILYGFPRAQLQVSEQALRMDDPVRRRGAYKLIAASWIERGVWDSALAVMNRFAASGLDPEAPLRNYGYAVLGYFLGGVPAGEVTNRRSGAGAAATDSAARAELAWLDGIAGYAGRDPAAVAQSRSALKAMGTIESARLEKSLAAFARALGGDSVAAGRELADLEWRESRGNAFGPARPETIAINRIAAARWLVVGRDYDQAARLLAFADGAYLLHPSQLVNASLYGWVAKQRAMVEELRGQAGLAREYEKQFQRWYDQPGNTR